MNFDDRTRRRGGDSSALDATVLIARRTEFEEQERIRMLNDSTSLDATVLVAEEQTRMLKDAKVNGTMVVACQAQGEENIDYQIEHRKQGSVDFADRFRYVCYFASGGMGRLAKHRDLAFDRIVAVKSLHDRFQGDERAIQAFLDECRLNARLDHPGIVPVYAMGKSEAGNWEVAMKLINGISLSAFIKAAREAYSERGRISARREQRALFSRLEYFIKICEVIEYCHGRNIVHGDLKPDNIMMGQYGEVYIMDWGSAQHIGTTPEHVSGTLSYIPSEYIQNHEVTPQIDVFALGMILFELVTLRRGKTTDDPSVDAANTRYNIYELREWHHQPNLKINPAIRAVIFKALNPDPELRYGTVAELAADVRHFLYDEEVSARPDGPVRRVMRVLYRNRIKTILVFTGSIIFLIGLLFALYFHSSRTEREYQKSMMQRIKFQSYTDELAVATGRNFFLGQAMVMLFADNLIESLANPVGGGHKPAYDNEDYRQAITSPPDMVQSKYYMYPVTLSNLVRFPAGSAADNPHWPDVERFTAICGKVVGTHFDSREINHAGWSAKLLLTQYALPHRLFVCWDDGTVYSFPGTFDDPCFPAYNARWKNPDNLNRERRILWGIPYPGTADSHRIVCRYPMYNARNEFLGVAAVEMRLDNLLRPLIEANKADPIHKFYYVDVRSRQAALVENNLIILPDHRGVFPNGATLAEILDATDKLRELRFNQFTMPVNKVDHFVSGAVLKIIDGIFIQMIEVEAMKNHHHMD